MKSLESFSNPVILIAGGRDKAGEFSLLRDLVKERVKALILIGEASEKIKKALGDITQTVMAQSLEDAVKASRDLAEKGDIVLLSPACASFDMFRDFEDRGRRFKSIVMELRIMERYDKWLLFVAAILTGFGALMIYSSTSVITPELAKKGATEFSYFKRHIFTIFIGIHFPFRSLSSEAFIH